MTTRTNRSFSFQNAWTHAGTLLRGRAPGQLIIQYTDKCNAACPQCDMRVSAMFSRSKLALDTAKRSIDHAAANGIAALSITGGEPLLYLHDVCALLQHAKDSGIQFTRTGTNGFVFMHPERADFEKRVSKICEALLAAGVYTFWISLDSADTALHERLRNLPGVTAGIRKALPIFHRHGLYPSVNLGVNRYLAGADSASHLQGDKFYEHYRHGFRLFYECVIDMGFTIVNCCYPMSGDDERGAGLAAVYQAGAADPMVSFTAAERSLLFRALYDTIPEYRHRIRIFSPRTSLLALQREHDGEETYASAACRGGIDYFFVDARDGDAYPCGYRGKENLGKFWTVDLSSTAPAATCRACDWECWRDPSELIAPVLGMRQQPGQWLWRSLRDRAYIKTWWQDLQYMRACDYYCAQKAPDFSRLAAFDLAPDTPGTPRAALQTAGQYPT